MKPVPERLAALAAGERFYSTGKPCRNGHISKRSSKEGICCACASTNSLRCMAKRPEHPNRIEARKKNETTYSTGEPCQNGHHSKRYTSSGQCKICSDAKHKEWHSKRPGLEAKWARERRAKDPSGHRAEVKRWKNKNPEKIKELINRWKGANPERAKELAKVGANNRRTKKAENGGRFTADDIDAIYEKQGGKCLVCPSTDRLEIDHIMPIKLGGNSNPSNLQILCRKCNRSKSSKHPDKWRIELTKGC